MAVNHMVAYSKSVTGAGIAAGAPYGCFLVEGADYAHDVCGMAPNDTQWWWRLDLMSAHLHLRARIGLVDPLINLNGTKLYLFSGHQDTVVTTSVMKALELQLSEFIGVANLKVDFDLNTTHGWVVSGSNCGPGKIGSESSSCSQCCCDPAPLLACDGYDLAGHMLHHLLGWKTGVQFSHIRTGRLLEIPQQHYLPVGSSLDSAGMWHTAYVFAPTICQDGRRCHVHVHYHGCVWGAEYLGSDAFMRLGFIEWAEGSGVVLVFPQASSTQDAAGCWDWTGKTGPLFDTKQGVQLATVAALVADLPNILLSQSDVLI